LNKVGVKAAGKRQENWRFGRICAREGLWDCGRPALGPNAGGYAAPAFAARAGLHNTTPLWERRLRRELRTDTAPNGFGPGRPSHNLKPHLAISNKPEIP